MSNLLISLAVVVAVFAGARSTWSPCGLSMLSTITPMAERSRGRSWGLTVGWFMLGAVLGGVTLGLLAALLAAVIGALNLSAAVALGTAAVLALVATAMDLGIGTEMPHHRRQVNEVWLDQYRSWVYGLGFGWQIGTGLATYIMTAGVYLTVALAALTGSPAAAMALCVLFGLVRGLAIFMGVRLTTPERLRAFHLRFETAGPTVRNVVIGVLALVGVVAGGAAWGLVGLILAALSVGGLVALSIGPARRSTPRPSLAEL